jgi:SAM-dependent methyltransferase
MNSPDFNAALTQSYLTGDQVRTSRLTPDASASLYRCYVRFIEAFTLPGRVLDVGCGAGWSTYWLAVRGYDATGIDLNPAAFEPIPQDQLRFVPGSALSLPFPDGQFDVAGAHAVLEHVSDPQQMLNEMIRVVRPGGVVCIVGPNLLGINPSVAALTWHVWRNRPVWRALVRSADQPREPFGNTLPEAVWALTRNMVLTARKTCSRQESFTMRRPDLRLPFHADSDATYLCNPLDLVRFFRRRGCVILRDTALGRPRWVRMLAGGTWIAARTPGGSPD